MQKLIVILLWSGIAVMIGCGKGEKMPSEKIEAVTPVVQFDDYVRPESIESLREKVKSRSLPYGQYGREDPFAVIRKDIAVGTAPNNIRKSRDSIRLEGIIWDEKNPLAVIEGKTLQKGDKVGEKIIEMIDRDSVTLFDGTNRIKLRL